MLRRLPKERTEELGLVHTKEKKDRHRSLGHNDERLVADALAESLMRSYSFVLLFVGHAIFALFVSGLIWLFELAMFNRGIGEWLSNRWYIPLLLFVASTLLSIASSRNREREANAIFDLSEEIDSSLISGGESVTGQLRVDHRPVDLVSVTATRRGIFLSKRTRIRAFFSWTKVMRIRPHRSTKLQLRAELSLRLGASSRQLHFDVPWTKTMSRFIPTELRTQEPN